MKLGIKGEKASNYFIQASALKLLEKLRSDNKKKNCMYNTHLT